MLYTLVITYLFSAKCLNSAQYTTTTQNPNASCSRHREAWHLITDEQRELYINGFKQLARDDKIGIFSQTHSNVGQHQVAKFLPWHRYFLYELETAFRELGDEYECFALPYWDWTYEIEQYEFSISDWHILNSGLSGVGDADNNYCVEGNFGSDEYDAYFGDCLARDPCLSDCSWNGQASKMMEILTAEQYYGDDDTDSGYRRRLENKHGSVHVKIGGDGHLRFIRKSTDDPIFGLLHSFVDFQYALWQDCWDYDLIDKNDITLVQYGNLTDVDEDMPFGLLATTSWADIAYFNVTARDMHNIEDWDVSYDKGDYFERAQVDSSTLCQNINEYWFKDITLSRRRLMKYEQDEVSSDFSEYSQDTFSRLNKRAGGDQKTEKQNKELYRIWSQMECEYLSMDSSCERPRYFDDCSDMIRDRYVECNGQYDIDITLTGLIEKVEDYPCMIKTRETYYNWAKNIGDLHGLCRGDYDTFCDTEFMRETGQDLCTAKCQKKSSKQGSSDKRKQRY